MFDNLTKNPNLKKNYIVFLLFFFFLGGGGAGVVTGGGKHNVQMFQMALLVFKEYKCAKLF